MRIIRQDILRLYRDRVYSYYGFTTHGVIRDGALVMNRGLAAKFKQDDPSLPWKFGSTMAHDKEQNIDLVVDTGVCFLPDCRVFSFQTIRDFDDFYPARMIRKSALMLRDAAISTPWKSFVCNLPKMDDKGLSRDRVIDLLSDLPDNVVFASLA